MTKDARHFRTVRQLRELDAAFRAYVESSGVITVDDLSATMTQILGIHVGRKEVLEFLAARSEDVGATERRYRARVERGETLVAEIRERIAKVDDVDDLAGEARLIAAKVRELIRVDDEVHQLDGETRADLLRTAEQLQAEAATALELRREAQRKLRRVIREVTAAPETVPAVVLCVDCGKRPRKFDDRCGRCAEAAGTRPKGKIV